MANVMSDRMGGKAGEINRASGEIPSGGVPKSRNTSGAGSKVGNETKADMAGAMLGQPTDMNPLAGAIRELGDQHPHDYHDHGPHHGTREHIRHMPLHGMKSGG